MSDHVEVKIFLQDVMREVVDSDLHHNRIQPESFGDDASAQQKTYTACRDVQNCLPSASLRNPNDPLRLVKSGNMRTRWGCPLEFGVNFKDMTTGSDRLCDKPVIMCCRAVHSAL